MDSIDYASQRRKLATILCRVNGLIQGSGAHQENQQNQGDKHLRFGRQNCFADLPVNILIRPRYVAAAEPHPHTAGFN